MIRVDDIVDFLQQILLGHEERRTMKVVVLGHGQIGKSTLVNFLKHKNKPLLKVTIILLLAHSASQNNYISK